MCNIHLIEEHNALHNLAELLKTKPSLAGYILANKVEPTYIAFRHDEIAKELLDRGINHTSPLSQPNIMYLPVYQAIATVNNKYWSKLLAIHCEDCRSKQHA